MKLRQLAFAAAGFLLLAGCETRKEQIFYDDDPDAVSISAVVGCVHTKSSPLGTSEELRSFSFNDVICVQTPDLVAEYYKSTSVWKPTDRYYFRWHKDPVTFQAYYPVNKSSGYDKFAVRPNQYSLDNLVASDYMTGEAKDMYRENVQIVLHRRMAKIRIRVAGVEKGQKVQALKIGSYSVYKDGLPEGSASISPYIESASIPAGENGTIYTALVIPGPADAKTPFITMTYKGASLKINGIPHFEQGYAYDYTLTFSGSTFTLNEPEVSCWVEGLPKGDLPDTPGEGGGEIEDPEDPGQDPGDDPGDDPLPPAKVTEYFVTPSGAGDKSGSSWVNAMGMAEFRPLISSDYGTKTADQCAALDGVTFHFMEGSYCVTTDEKDRLKLHFGAYGKSCKVKILGGYDQTSTGTDLTKRDIRNNITKFTGDRNGNGKADSGDTGIFCLDAWVDVTFDGCHFAHSYGADRWKQKAFMVNTDVEGAIARVNLTNCKIYDICDFDDSDAKYEGGSAIWLCKNSVATLHNCEIYGCSGVSRGGALRSNDATSVFFVNNCAIHGNTLKDIWGNAVQISNGNFMMNNSTIAQNTGAGGALNGGGNWIVVNSTIINAHVSGNDARDMALRNESNISSNNAILMNSIVLFDGDKPGVFMNDQVDSPSKNLTSKGYNLYDTVGGCVSSFTTNAADKAGMSISGLGLTWNAAGYYTWNGNVDAFTKAKLADVESAVKTGCNKTVLTFSNIGIDYYNWLQSVGGGKNPLAYDQLGNARSATAMWPGAYEKH